MNDIVQNKLTNMLRSEDSLASFDFFFNNYSSAEAAPEKLMMMEVLVTAIIDYLSPTRQSFFNDAEEWLFYPDPEEEEYLYSFKTIALTLNLSRSHLLKKLRQRKHEKGDFALDGKRVNVI